MSGQSDEIWSKEPPSEPGHYWAYDPQYDKEIIVCRRAFEFFESVQWDFSLTPEQYAVRGFRTGPRIPSPTQLTAAAKRVEELEGEVAALQKALDDNWVSHQEVVSMRGERDFATSQLSAMKAVEVNNEPLEERLGRRIRQVWMDWAKEQPDIAQRPDWLDPWELLPERIKEVDRRLGCAIWGDCVSEFSEAIAFHALHNTTNGECER